MAVLVISKVSHDFGVTDVCSQTDIHSGALSTIRGARSAQRNFPSHANMKRTPAIAEEFPWAIRDLLTSKVPRLCQAPVPGQAREASQGHPQHRLHYAATGGQLHGLGLASTPHGRRQSTRAPQPRGLPATCIVVDTFREADIRRAPDLTAMLEPGEDVMFDRGSNDHGHLEDLKAQDVTRVTRYKKGQVYRVLGLWAASGLVHENEVIPLSNHEDWTASTIVDLCQARRRIEVSFRQLKQTLKQCDLTRYSANGIRCQAWARRRRTRSCRTCCGKGIMAGASSGCSR